MIFACDLKLCDVFTWSCHLDVGEIFTVLSEPVNWQGNMKIFAVLSSRNSEVYWMTLYHGQDVTVIDES